MKPVRLESASMRELLGLDPRHGVYTADLVRPKPRKRKFAKTPVKRGPRKAVAS